MFLPDPIQLPNKFYYQDLVKFPPPYREVDITARVSLSKKDWVNLDQIEKVGKFLPAFAT